MLVECKYCKRNFNVEPEDISLKFEGDENEFLQNECLKLEKRIDKYKNDLSTSKTAWKVRDLEIKIRSLTKIRDILERFI